MHVAIIRGKILKIISLEEYKLTSTDVLANLEMAYY